MVDDLILRRPEDKDSNNLKGLILLKMDRPEEAIPYLEKPLNSDPSHYQALINMGTGEYDRSRKALESARAQALGRAFRCFV